MFIFSLQNELSVKYPNEFLDGRYRQEVIFYKNKFYAFGGGNIDGDAYNLDQVKDKCLIKTPFLKKLLEFLFLKVTSI